MPTIWFFLLAGLGFGFVIFIHELGHFVFAKWAGVKVLVFSIGFGPKILRRTIGETEYALSVLPFGGYVKMLGQDDDPRGIEDAAAQAHDPRSFLAVHVKWRVAILFGGVLFNFLSSYLILITLAFSGMPATPPRVGDVKKFLEDRQGKNVDSPAYRLGMQVGDRILTIDGATMRSFDDVLVATVFRSRDPMHVRVLRRGETTPRDLPADQAVVVPVYSSDFGIPVLGITGPWSNRIDEVLSAGSDPANPQPGERLVAFDGTPVITSDGTPLCGQEIEARLLPKLGTKVSLTLEKDHRQRTTDIVYAGDANNPASTGFPVVMLKVTPGSNADKAGLRGGDILLRVEQVPMLFPDQTANLLHQRLNAELPCHLTVFRPDFATATAAAPMAAGALGSIVELDIHGGEVDGRAHEIGVLFGQQLTGMVRALPTLISGADTPLTAAGVHAGDTVIAYQAVDPAAPDQERRKHHALGDQSSDTQTTTLRLLHGGSQVLVPLSEASFTAADTVAPLPFWARWLNMTQPKSVYEQLPGTQVQEGALAPGFIRVRAVDGVSVRDVDLRDLDAANPGLLKALQPHDWIVGVTSTPSHEFNLELLRGAQGEPRSVAYNPGVAFGFGIEEVPYHLSSWREAFTMVNTTSYNNVVKALQIIPRFFRSADNGGVNPNKSLQGPVGMFSMLKSKAQYFGFGSYMKLVALIGLNLFLVNLLPIPITDGGQLLILGIETAIGRPIPVRLQALLQWAGLIFVVMLMLYVFGLDISRLL
jgi:membrane-associated protease RseP (regulator of RpoE activity)